MLADLVQEVCLQRLVVDMSGSAALEKGKRGAVYKVYTSQAAKGMLAYSCIFCGQMMERFKGTCTVLWILHRPDVSLMVNEWISNLNI